MIEHILSIIVLSLIWIESFKRLDTGYKKYMNTFYMTLLRHLVIKMIIFGSFITIVVACFETNTGYINVYIKKLSVACSVILQKSMYYLFIIESVNLLTK